MTKENKNHKRFGYQTAEPGFYSKLKERQKEFKKYPTNAEKILWKELSTKKIGYKFRRQHIIDKYVVDFVCLKQKLVVEVDGSVHRNRQEEDALRTVALENLGFRVIRFYNSQIENNCNEVIQQIIKELQQTEECDDLKPD